MKGTAPLSIGLVQLIPAAVSLVLASLLVGFFAGKSTVGSRPEFHDIRVNHPEDYVVLVDPECEFVRSLAEGFETHREAYEFVRDDIAFDPSMMAAPPKVLLQEKKACCLGHAVLLCSLYRALGTPPEKVRVVVGELAIPGRTVEHAWVELKYQEKWLQHDPTGFIGEFEFHDFPDKAYTDNFVRKESYCFNDRGFAVVSQLNRLRGVHSPVSSETPSL